MCAMLLQTFGIHGPGDFVPGSARWLRAQGTCACQCQMPYSLEPQIPDLLVACLLDMRQLQPRHAADIAIHRQDRGSS